VQIDVGRPQRSLGHNGVLASRDERSAEEAAAEVLAAYAIGDGAVPARPVLLEAMR